MSKGIEAMKRIVFALLIVLALSGTGRTEMENMEYVDKDINTRLMHSTFKLKGEGSAGTGFVLLRPKKSNPEILDPVLVTAAHVLEKMTGEEAWLFLRRKNSSGIYVEFPYTIKIRANGKPLWKTHSDVDVAAMNVKLPNDIEKPDIKIDYLADDKRLRGMLIHPGDELMCLGFPFGWVNPGAFPFLRSGNIASYPLLPTTLQRTFLLDIDIFEGNSGSPVSYYYTTRWDGKGWPPYSSAIYQGIAGLVIGDMTAEKVLSESWHAKTIEKLRVGLAIVVHASLIRETIDLLPEASSS